MCIEQALSWNEGADDERNGLRIVVIKHMFTPEEIENEAYEDELRDDILAECLKMGEVSKVRHYELMRCDGSPMLNVRNMI